RCGCPSEAEERGDGGAMDHLGRFPGAYSPAGATDGIRPPLPPGEGWGEGSVAVARGPTLTPTLSRREKGPSSPRLIVALVVWVCSVGAGRATLADEGVEQWGMYEINLNGPSAGNPFTEVDFSARFTHGDEAVTVSGFYDGDGVYRIRFLPEQRG